MTMTDLRDRIVEAVEQDVSTQYYAVGSVEVEGIADAVIAVLADLPADVIEQAARAHKPDLWADDWATASRFVFQTHSESWDAALALARAGQQRDIRAVLAAVFGGGQA